ncbi:MAG: TIGR03089 family protein [Nocardioidaceae bacterium]
MAALPVIPKAWSVIPEAWEWNVRAGSGRPFLTFYDDATGERIELSYTSMDNWVAKTANLLADEFDREPGDVLCIDLPTHWQSVVFMLAAWTVGMRVGIGLDGSADVQVVAGRDADAESGHEGEVVACSLRPMGGPCLEPLPPGMHDFAIVVSAQPDHFAGTVDLAATTPAARRERPNDIDHAELLAQGRQEVASLDLERGSRLLTDTNPASDEGLGLVVGLLAMGASVVLVGHLDPSTISTKASQERASHQLWSAHE